MTRHSDQARLRNMLEHSREAIEMMRGRTRSDLDSDRKLNLAPVRLLEIAGEASSRVTEDTRKLHPEISWVAIAGMRNRLIHGYDEIDFDILWRVVREDLPNLVAQLEAIR